METNKAEQLARRYIHLWNEPDAPARRTTIEALWASEGRHLMGAHDVTGYDGLEQRVKGSYQRSVVAGGNLFRLVGAVQTLPGVVKFRWDMARQASGEVAAAGVGFLLLDGEGKIANDFLFAES
jgi:hypothetical protein